ncbi:phosphotransferase [Paenibacillus terreus]|uniref:Phosphotransferase n=1 Tax=Paenibacillus terreus TaxID=1387834 RepID=A0ABV5B5Z4_9BACL
MENIKEILHHHYRLEASHVIPQQGGWSALAYRVTTGEQSYFLKLYDKSRASTPKLTALINIYSPLLLWLHDNSRLKGKVPVPLATQDGRYQCEDDEGIYLLYKYIAGETIGERELTPQQTAQLAGIVSELHSFGSEVPVNTAQIKEEFELPFLHSLKQVIGGHLHAVPTDIRDVLYPFIEPLNALISATEGLSQSLKHRPLRYALCHTDLHNWNLMQSGDDLVLIDWEGIRLAPVEADMMFIVDQPYYDVFLDMYTRKHPDYVPNPEALNFYQGRRKLEDIWEWTELLLFNSQDARERGSALHSLANELKSLHG